NWTAGGPGGQVPPTLPFVMPTGGPAGAGDQFLVITSIGCLNPATCGDPTSPQGTGTPGAILIAINRRAQWAGNYLTSGISAISMYLENLGNTTLTMRLIVTDAPAFDDTILST